MLFRRSRPLHERLAEEADLDIGGEPLPSTSGAPVQGGGEFLLGLPDLLGNPSPLGEVGFHGVPRPRRWDAVASVQAELPGEEAHFVVLADGTLIVDEDMTVGAIAPLTDALEETLLPPYRARGIRRGHRIWAVAGTRIEVREIQGHDDEDELEIVEGDEVILGRRLHGDLWEVEVSRL